MLAIAIQMMEGDTVLHTCNNYWFIEGGAQYSEDTRTSQAAKVNKCHVYYVKQLFEETDNVCDHPQDSQPCSTCMKNVVTTVHTRITQNPCHTQKILFQEMNLALKTISCVLTIDLGLRAYKRYTRHLFEARLRCLRLKRLEKLLHIDSKKICSKELCSRMRKLLPQNRNSISKTTRCMHGHYTRPKQKLPEFKEVTHPSSVMLWWKVLWNGATVIHFCKSGVKMIAKIYEETGLQALSEATQGYFVQGATLDLPARFSTSSQVKTLSRIAHKQRSWIYSRVDWAPGNPDLNPLDYELRDILRQNACQKLGVT